MKLTQEQQDIITEFAEDKDYSILADYSGRCMYGSKCFGLVGLSPVSMGMELASHLAHNDEVELADRLARGVRQDSMGLDSIIYFPNVEWNEGDAEEVDTEEVEEALERHSKDA